MHEMSSVGLEEATDLETAEQSHNREIRLMYLPGGEGALYVRSIDYRLVCTLNSRLPSAAVWGRWLRILLHSIKIFEIINLN